MLSELKWDSKSTCYVYNMLVIALKAFAIYVSDKVRLSV